MEFTWNGKEPLKLKGGEERLFLNDGDRLELRGYSGSDKKRVGFGECTGKVLPALPAEYFQN
jgi:fumarylacetoacetase